MDTEKGTKRLDGYSTILKSMEDELDRRAYHLKTLFDVSTDIFAAGDLETTLRNFLLMTTGNFGITEGFVLTKDLSSGEITHLISVGFEDNDHSLLSDGGNKLLLDWDRKEKVFNDDLPKSRAMLHPVIECVFYFCVDDACNGLLGLGSKIVGEPYSKEDKDLLVTLVNNLTVAVKNARSFEDIKHLNLNLQGKNIQLEKALNDLDRRNYYLKTLYDISKDIFSSVDFKAILKSFLMMIMGNFGIIEGHILILGLPTEEILYFHSNGTPKSDVTSIEQNSRRLLLDRITAGETFESVEVFDSIQKSMPNIACYVPFRVDEECFGSLGLGSKLVGEPYSEHDKELLATFVNNLIVSLKNARSFENIKSLNLDLQEKNIQLEKILKELQEALRKVEILESVKSKLSKFVPTSVTRMIERSPSGDMLDAKERDVSVLFLDIQGYTKLNERLGGSKLNELVEKYFSVFMEAIFANNGDVNETTGDGLMVIFHSEDEATNALEAVRAAFTIREKAALISREDDEFPEALVINMGINSGKALLGAVKFDSFTGSRWTYTARGMITNVAARIGTVASEGAILLAKSTADRVKEHFSLESLGTYNLRNVSEKVELFAVKGNNSK